MPPVLLSGLGFVPALVAPGRSASFAGVQGRPDKNVPWSAFGDFSWMPEMYTWQGKLLYGALLLLCAWSFFYTGKIHLGVHALVVFTFIMMLSRAYNNGWARQHW
ncbi:hypothetical protein ABPG77_005894 [Micractinium sp. CCAP 211/92]